MIFKEEVTVKTILIFDSHFSFFVSMEFFAIIITYKSTSI